MIAMANLAYQHSQTTGVDLTFAAADVAGDTVAVGNDAALLVVNDDAASIDVTIAVPGSKYGQDLADITHAVPAGETAIFGPFPGDLADDSDRRVHVSYSAVANVTVAAISV